MTFAIAEHVTAGILINAAPWLGAHGLASSVAWLAMNPVEREDYRRYGSLEAEIASAGIVRRFVWRIKSGDESVVADRVKGDFTKISADDIFQASRAGDGVSISVVRDTAKYIGMAVGNLATMLDPEIIVLGGVDRQLGRPAPGSHQGGMRPAPAAATVRARPHRLVDARHRRRRHRRRPGRRARRRMIVLAGAVLVLPDRVIDAGSIVVGDGRIQSIHDRAIAKPAGATYFDLAGHVIVPGFIDVHVHGVEGVDVLDDDQAVARVAAILPKYGVTAFCPTSIACTPEKLAALLAGVTAARASRAPGSARVLPAHLESNFINPEYNGAQPDYLLAPSSCTGCTGAQGAQGAPCVHESAFTGDDILAVIAKAAIERRHRHARAGVARWARSRSRSGGAWPSRVVGPYRRHVR